MKSHWDKALRWSTAMKKSISETLNLLHQINEQTNKQTIKTARMTQQIDSFTKLFDQNKRKVLLDRYLEQVEKSSTE